MKGALDTFWDWRARIEDHRSGNDFGVTWDIETERLDPGSPTLCISMAQGGQAVVFAGNMLHATEFLDRLTPGQLLIAHHMKYEAQSLIARGIDPRQFVWWDTMLAEWVLLANNPRGLGLNLDDTAQRYGLDAKDPYVDEMIKAGRVMEVEPAKLQERNRKDTQDTQTVAARQMARMTEAQIRLTITRCMMAVELAYIEGIPSKDIGGMRLDPERVRAECARNAAEIAEHETALRDITKGANPKSVNEMAPVLYGIWPGTVKPEDRVGVESLGFTEPNGTRTAASKPRKPKPPYKDGRPRPVEPVAWPDGKPSIAKEVMAMLAEKARTPRQKMWAKHYLALMEAMAERDKNLTFYRGVVEQAVGVVYAELMQGITATHRLSCRSRLRVTVDGKEYGCQLQNTPRHLKGCFIAKEPGWLACSVDQSQAEFRGAIFLADDDQGRADIVNPRFDAHIQTLTVMLNGQFTQLAYDNLFDRYKAGDKEVAWQRADNRLCKGHTFKPLFGGSSGTDTERSYYKWFGRHYSGVTAMQNAWDDEVQKTGQYIAPTGMAFHWDRTWKVNKWGRNSMVSAITDRSLYSIVRNLPIQYLATGELAMVSTLCLVYECRLQGLRYIPAMLIHDDTSGQVHPEDAAAWHTACGVAYGPMTHKFFFDVYSINYDVELAAESKAGVRFGEGSKQEHSYSSPISEDARLMKISAKGSGGNRPPDVKSGTHLGIINALVDLGVQPGSAKFPQPKRKVYVGVEFPKVIVEYKKDDVVEKAPARLGRFFALSMNEKATFRKWVCSLLGRTFANDKEAGDYDVRAILEMPGMFPVEHKLVGETTYANLGNPVPLMEGITLDAKLSKPALFYDTDAHEQAAFDALPDWLKEIVNGRVIPSKGASNSPAAITGGLPDIGQE